MAANPCHGGTDELAELRASLAALGLQVGQLQQQVLGHLAEQELAVQKERDRIAQEIHDGVAQHLALLLLKMEVISRLADSDPHRMKAELRKVISILETATADLRRSISSLRPPEAQGPTLLS